MKLMKFYYKSQMMKYLINLNHWQLLVLIFVSILTDSYYTPLNPQFVFVILFWDLNYHQDFIVNLQDF